MASSALSYRNSGSSPSTTAWLGRFFRWWGRELAAFVPVGLRPLPKATGDFLWVDFSQDQLILWRVVAGKRQETTRIELAGLDAPARKLAFDAALRKLRRPPVAMSVPAGQLLRKTITMPLAVKDNMRQVVGFELSRHTPFQPSQALYDCQIQAEDHRKGTLDLLLTVAPSYGVETGLRQLQDWGCPPHALVAVEDILSGGRYANLLPISQRPRGGFPVWLGYLTMVLLTVILLATAIAVPLRQKQEIVDALSAKLALAQSEAEAIEGLRLQFDQVSEEYQYLLEKKYSRPSTAQLLEEVSGLLPDDTWLSQFGVKTDGEVSLQGETSSSASLIRLIERSALLTDAGFRAPLVKAGGRLERFQLGAKVRSLDLSTKVNAASTLEKAKVPTVGPGGAS